MTKFEKVCQTLNSKLDHQFQLSVDQTRPVCFSLMMPCSKQCPFKPLSIQKADYRTFLQSLQFINITNSPKPVGLKQIYYCITVRKLFQSKVSCDTFVDLFLLSIYLFFQRYEKPLFTSVSFQKVLEKHKQTFNTEQVLFLLIYI